MRAKPFMSTAVRMLRARWSLLLMAAVQESCPTAFKWLDVLDLILCRAGGRYSHRVGAPATVALLADDGCAEMLWVGERESVECLRRT